MVYLMCVNLEDKNSYQEKRHSTKILLCSERDKLMKAFKDDSRGKLSMKELFGVRKLTKSGTPGKVMFSSFSHKY